MRRTARVIVRDVRRQCTHAPVVTAATVGAVLSTAVRLRVFDQELPLLTSLRYGFSGRTLTMGHWHTLATSQFLSRDPFMAISIACSLVLMLGLYEAVAGSARALVVAAMTAVAGPLAVAGGLALGEALGNGWAGRTLSTIDYGASSVTAGAGAALVAVLGRRGLRRLAVLWVLGGLLVHHQLADWEHLGSFVVGYGLGRVLGVAPPLAWPRARARISHATAVAVVGAGLWGGSVGAAHAVPLASTQARAASTAGSESGETTVASSPPSPARVVETSYPTPSLGGGTRKVFVILPEGYDEARARYPVVELLHGAPGAASDVIAGLDPLAAAAAAAAPPFIGLAPDGHGPVVSDGDFADTSRQHLGAALSDDLRRWADTSFRTNHHWSVAGLSSGGYGAAYLGSRTEGAYDAVCSLSGYFTARAPAFADESGAARDAASPLLHARASGPRTLLVTGTGDAEGVREARGYEAAMDHAGQPNRVVLVPGSHDWGVWKAELPDCLRYMLNPQPTARAGDANPATSRPTPNHAPAERPRPSSQQAPRRHPRRLRTRLPLRP